MDGIFCLILIIISIYFFKRECEYQYQSAIHPFLWSCLYKQPDYKMNNSHKSQFNEDKLFNKLFFKYKLNGIFVELGALDGILYSNTYFYEHYLGWSGILIEGGYGNCMNLINNQNKRPRSQIVCSAVCKNNEYIDFKQGGPVGGVKGELPQKWFGMENKTGIKTKCSNIGEILHHFHITHIDFFSLDVEGSEFSVLETFDFSIIVNYWTIEFNSKDNNKNRKVRNMLRNKGYRKCKIQKYYTNECYEYPLYEKKVKKLIEIEKKYRTNFGTKCE